jgi:hypothetical protein
VTFSNPAATATASARSYAEALLGVLRAANLAILRPLGPTQLERLGMHSERGPESLGHLTKLMAAHDLVHRRQIERVLAAAGA